MGNTEESTKAKTSRTLEKIASSHIARRAYFVFQRIPLLKSLLRRSLDKLLPKGQRVWTRVPKGRGKGLWVFADPRFDPDYLTGEHEVWVQDLLATHLNSGKCFYDIGAHIGFFSLIAGRLVGPSGSVTAFEPDPDNVAILRANSQRNHMHQVNALEVAVWDCEGELSFKRSDSASSGMEGHVIEDREGINHVVTVNTISLDDYVFKNLQRSPDFLKIDVEGGESRVLSGATQTLERCKPLLLCEVHDLSAVQELKLFLERFNYVAEEHPSGGKSYLWAEPKR